jgi:hypothetical protein
MMASRLTTVLISLLLAVTLASSACAEPQLFMEPVLTEVWTGYDCWVDVSVNAEVLGITGFDLEIDYDESVVELMEVVEGSLPQSSGGTFFFWTYGPAPENAIVINGAVLGDSVDGPGVLARLHFAALVPGVSPLDFLSLELRDLQNNPIAVTDVGGEIHVSDPPTIYLTPPMTVVTEGTYFTVDVAINESLVSLTGYNLRIVLDSSVVQFVGATEGPLPPSGGDETAFYWMLQDPDTIIINGAVLGSWVDGPGVLAHVELFALSVGATPMEFLSVELRDLDNNPIPAFRQDALIIVEEGGSATEETSWAAIKALYR